MTEAPPPAEPDQQLHPERLRTYAPSVNLANLLSALICLAQELIHTLPRLPRAEVLTRFGILDFKLITARLTRGLMLAEALENRVASTAQRIDNPPLPRTRPAKPRTQAARRPRFSWEKDNAALLAGGLPSAEEIAEQIRRRPIGAVLADICRDLGISPHDHLFGLLSQAIIRHGGNIVTLMEQTPRMRGGFYDPKPPGQKPAQPRMHPAPMTPVPMAVASTGPP